MKTKIMSIMLLVTLLISIFSSINSVNAFTVNTSSDNPVFKSTTYEPVEVVKLIKSGTEWVAEINASVGSILRFKITVTYHDTDGPFPEGDGYILTNIKIKDILPAGLAYIGNASKEYFQKSEDNKTIIWKFIYPLEDNQSHQIEFDVLVTNLGEQINKVNVSAIEQCCGESRWAEAQAIVNAKGQTGYTLKLNVEPNDSAGYVTVNPDKLLYQLGEKVTLDAVANHAWKFAGFSGDVISDKQTINITIEGNTEITANFKVAKDAGPSVNITVPEENYKYFFNIKLNELPGKTEIVGPINIKAEVVESDKEIDRVEFFIDGELVKNDTRVPYNSWWFFKNPLDDKDEYTIKVVAYDSEGNFGTDSITVIRKQFTPFRNHKNFTLGLIGLGGILGAWYLLKNLGAEPGEVIPVEPDDGGGGDDGSDGYTDPVSDVGGPYSGVVGKAIRFDGSASQFSNPGEVTYTWDFGDGTKGSGVSPMHKYDKAGTYIVKLTVSDSKGSHTATTEAEISEAEGDLFWYIVSGMTIGLIAILGALYFRRRLYV